MMRYSEVFESEALEFATKFRFEGEFGGRRSLSPEDEEVGDW